MEPAQETGAAQPRRSTWETIVTVTPVVLTVLGTLLAGLSSSEMTLGQYFRTLAAQSQSKAGDQWGFFQAKRIRGSALELSLDGMPIFARTSDHFPREAQAAFERMDRLLTRSPASLVRLERTFAEHKASLDEAHRDALTGILGRLSKAQASYVPALASNREAFLGKLSRVQVSKAADLFRAVKVSAIDNAPLRAALEILRRDGPETEIEPLLHEIRPDDVRAAIALVGADARAFDDGYRPIDKAFSDVAQQLDAQIKGVGPYHEAVLDLDAAVLDVTVPEVRTAVVEVSRSHSAIRAAAQEVSDMVRTTRSALNATRYRIEGDYNQQTAQLYEIEVRRNSVISERHRVRSRQFFVGMLFAQAGVTIASLSLAARQQSLLWALAGVAGLTALAFSLYVYLYV